VIEVGVDVRTLVMVIGIGALWTRELHSCAVSGAQCASVCVLLYTGPLSHGTGAPADDARNHDGSKSHVAT